MDYYKRKVTNKFDMLKPRYIPFIMLAFFMPAFFASAASITYQTGDTEIAFTYECNPSLDPVNCPSSDYGALTLYDLDDSGNVNYSSNPATSPFVFASSGTGAVHLGIIVYSGLDADTAPFSPTDFYGDPVVLDGLGMSYATSTCTYNSGTGVCTPDSPSPPIPPPTPFPDNDATSTPSQTQENIYHGFVIFWVTLVFVIWFFRKR